MLGDRRSPTAAADASPTLLQALLLLAPCQGQVERLGHVPGPVGQGLEAGVVLVPPLRNAGIGLEQFLLLSQGRLLVVGAVERVEVGEELLRVRLHHVPRRVADHGVEPAPLGREHVGELQLPVEELACRRPACRRATIALSDGSAWKVSGVGTCRSDSSSVGQNQTAHHSSIAALSAARTGSLRSMCSR